MRIAAYHVVSAIFMVLAICNPTFAMMICEDLHEDPSVHAHMKELYEYALIAEIPANTRDCIVSDDSSDSIQSPRDIVQLVIPDKLRTSVLNGADNRRANLRITDGGTTLGVGCAADTNNRSILVEYGFKILARIVGDGAFFYLTGTEVMGGVIVRSTGEYINTVPGTDLLDRPEIMANFDDGENCAFPLVKETVSVLCEALSMRWHSPVYESLAGQNSHKVKFHKLENHSHSLTMVGHSLGGSAT